MEHEDITIKWAYLFPFLDWDMDKGFFLNKYGDFHSENVSSDKKSKLVQKSAVYRRYLQSFKTFFV